jgi:hypothetical protein
MSNIKKLIWEDNITDLGKQQDFFSLVSHFQLLNLRFEIINKRILSQRLDNASIEKLNLKGEYFIELDGEISGYKTIEEAKNYTQKYFEKRVMSLFFDGVILFPTKEDFENDAKSYLQSYLENITDKADRFDSTEDFMEAIKFAYNYFENKYKDDKL